MKKKVLIISGILLICIFSIAGVSALQKKKISPKKVDITYITKKEIPQKIIAAGKLSMVEEQTVYYQPDLGEIEKVYPRIGDEIRIGDELVRYDSQELESEIQKNKIELNLKYLEINKIKRQISSIRSKNSDSPLKKSLQVQIDDLQYQEKQINLQTESLLIDQEILNKRLNKNVIHSKINGSVLAVDEEMNSASTKPIIHIGNLNNFIVQSDVSEYDSLKIKKNQIVLISSDNFPGKKWKGKIKSISDLPNSVDDAKQSPSYRIYAEFNNEKVVLKPGYKMLLEVEIEKQKVNTLPLSSVKQTGDKEFIYIIQNGKAKKHKIETGLTTKELIELKTELPQGTKVIKDSKGINDGMEVRM